MADLDCVEPYPSWLRWYKKPSYVDINDFALKVNEGRTSPKTSLSRERSTASIPDRLSLKRILANQTCSPLSLHDFYMYLKHIEHSSENLEFFVWYHDYVSRYEKSQELLEQWSKLVQTKGSTLENGSDHKILNSASVKHQPITSDATQEKHEQGEREKKRTNLMLNIGSLLSLDTTCGLGACAREQQGDSSLSRLAKSIATKFSRVNTADSPDTSPTLDELEFARQRELAAVSALFLMPNSPRELNVTSAMRKTVLEKIDVSTSPLHLKEIAEHCHLLLQSCSHRNFIRLGVSNGTFETVCMATSAGIILTLLAFLAVALLASVKPPRQHSRWEVVGLWPMWFVGGGLILSGLRGSCFFFLLFSRRQPLPWELYEDDSSVHLKGSEIKKIINKINLFDRKLKVKDIGLRRLQRKIVVQSLVGGAIFATVLIICFISLPIWRG